MQRDDLLKKMQGRVDQCRRLARSTTDELTAKALNEMAAEGEADIARVLNENKIPLRADSR